VTSLAPLAQSDLPGGAPWRAWVFVGAWSLFWITLRPFSDLGSAELADLVSGREIVSYVCSAALAATCLAIVAATDRGALKCLATPAYIGLAGWLALSSATSQDAATSLKRAAACGFVVVIAAALPLLPQGRRHLARLLLIAAAAPIALSYIGVIVLPQLAIHQASDFLEPNLAGDWRGLFAHKNDASSVFVILIFIGLYVVRAGLTAQGALICASSLLFLIFTHGKTANALWLPTIGVSLIVMRGAAGPIAMLALLAPLIALNALGVGSLLSAPLASLTASLPIDATFSGRTDIWRFALDGLSSHSLLGYGFSAFWNTAAVRFSGSGPTAWVSGASHGHNGYLDAALSMGLPGLGLTIWALIVQPMADLRRALRHGADSALVMLLTQIWLFCLYASSLESFLFDRGNPAWMALLFAVFGLRYVACFRTLPE